MRNKPNFRNAKINITSFLIKDYEDFRLRRRLENKPNSNPIKAKTKPNKADTNPKQTQSNPIAVPLAPFIVYNYRKIKKEFCI